MTEPEQRDVAKTTYYRRRPRLSTLALTVRTAMLGGIATLAVGAGLTLQMARGGDPALSGTTQADATRPRIVQTTVVKRIVPATSGSSSSGTSSSGSSGYTAPAPAAAPAPVTSSSS